MQKKINLGVIFYGNKGQIAANRKQFADLRKALKDFQLKKYDLNRNQWKKLVLDRSTGVLDVVLKNSYGRKNESRIENFLDAHNIAYLGSGAKAVITGTNKYLAKKAFKAAGLPMSPDIYVNKKLWTSSPNNIINLAKNKLGFPCLIKDIAGTDSRGIKMVRTPEQLSRVLKKILSRKKQVILEKYIPKAYEATCLVVGNNKPYAYEPVGILKNSEIWTAEMKDKYAYIAQIPARLPAKIIQKIKKVSIAAHKVLGCRTFSRADILVKGNKLYLLEVDVHPGFRKTSPTVLSAKYEKKDLNRLFLSFFNFIQ